MRFHDSVIIACLVVITLTGNKLVSAQSRCVNPNSNRGICQSIYDCPILYSVITKPNLLPEDRRFLVASQCTGATGRTPHVCCTDDAGFISRPTTSTTQQQTNVVKYPIMQSSGRGNVLPSPPQCGIEPTGRKIYSGNNTALDEYPWMVILEYRRSNGNKELNCAGSLINQRYVLTAAHCITGRILTDIGQLESIRLGEYDLQSDIDCVESDCADPILVVGVEDIIPHAGYADQNVNRHHDIGLVRLSQDVQYTGFIRPVCLPSILSASRSSPGTELVVAGWGRTLTSRSSQIKQKLFVPVAPQSDCASKFGDRGVNIIDGQLCAGGRFAQDSCDGDSGGPLMKNVNTYWIIEGIVSFGRFCGLEGWPAVYTRVSSYEDWIRSNLRP